jgi:hypothetical protein
MSGLVSRLKSLRDRNRRGRPELRISRRTILPFELRRDIAILICIKVFALLVIYQLFFGPPASPPVGERQVESRLFGSASSGK